MSQPLTRQQIYDRIRASSKDSFILEEMKRLGFWENTPVPTPTDELIQTETRLRKELDELLAQDRKYSDQEAMLREMRKKRMADAKLKRAETKQKKEEKKKEKAKNWVKTTKSQIIYLGEKVSAGLNHTENDNSTLKKRKLPVFSSVLDLAAKVGIDLAQLKYLTFHRKVSLHSHYHTFEVDKKSGGKRKISAPKPKLKALQRWILDSILCHIPLEDYVHGFVENKSIISNASTHVQKDILINIDLKDFFPTISYKRVKGLFRKLGYSEQVATVLALACTQAQTHEVEMDGLKYYVQEGERFLPQGSPASPAISNIIVYKLDKRINGLAKKYGFTYSRYADDLTFSGAKESEENIAKLLFFVGKIIADEDFKIHPDKTHIMRSKAQQKVTGIVVNEKLNIESKKLHQFRALLHNIEVNGWQNQTWGKAQNLIQAIDGFINFVHMVNPSKAEKFKEKLALIVLKHGRPLVEVYKVEKSTTREEIENKVVNDLQKETPSKSEPNTQADWWKLF